MSGGRRETPQVLRVSLYNLHEFCGRTWLPEGRGASTGVYDVPTLLQKGWEGVSRQCLFICIKSFMC
jgi:hypothetical protein